MQSPYSVVKDFEAGLCEYSGAPYAVTCTSCTMALLLACAWHRHKGWSGDVSIPKRTYVSVPMSVKHAGFNPVFRDVEWSGHYYLDPLPVVDSARWLTTDMYIHGEFQCVSFHATKTLGDTQGGAILHDDPEADKWLRKARFDGRTEGVTPKDDAFDMIGWHCYMSPDVAARLLLKLSALPKINTPLPNDNYPGLSTLEIFR